jgi:predicted nucleic acid-binding protein
MSSSSPPPAAFLDTCILLNYLYQPWEGDKVSTLLEEERVDHVISESVAEEFDVICDRRSKIYPDLLDFLLETEENVETFDPDERDLWIDANDTTHVRTLLGTLAQLEDRREVQARVRRFIRRLDAQIQRLQTELLDEVVEQNPHLGLQFRLADVIPNRADVKVVCDAAYWRAEGGGHGPFVTLDKTDIVENRDAINTTLTTERGETWRLEISVPKEVLSEFTKAVSDNDR